MATPIPTWILAAQASLSVLLVAYEVTGNINEARKTQFFKRKNDAFRDVISTLPEDHYRALRINADTFIIYTRLNKFLKLNDIPVVAATRSYTLPPELQRHGKRFLRHILGNPALFGRRFDDPCLGWNTDMEDPELTEPIEVVFGSYFDVTQSDELAMYDTEVDGRTVSELGRSLFVKRDGRLRGFRTSWLFNVVGASTIAITDDGQLVLTEQTAANAGSHNLFAPSGSGAAGPQDLKRRDPTLSQLAEAASTRELREEVNLGNADIADNGTHLLGFGRWLQRAARGELLCVTFLDIDSDTVNRRPISASERIYIRKAKCVRFAEPIANWDPSDPERMLPTEQRTRMSVPLGAALSLLAEEVLTPDSDVRRELIARGVI
nr:hypothetical protein Mflv_2264 [Mycolicibacterium gilvum PYR-GCK]